MCDLHDHQGLPPLDADEFVLDTPFVRELVAAVRGADRTARRPRPRRASASGRSFEAALATRDWLPAEFQRDVPDSGMGGGIGQWLLFRSADRSLCLFSLVVPPGSMTPIHDHLAWGLVGLYRGNQDEEFYAPGDGTIELTRRRPLAPGRLLRAAAAAPTTSTGCGRRPPRRRSRSTCSRTTRAAPSATPSTS